MPTLPLTAHAEPATIEETEVRERLAPLHSVICHDDPITTMEFVVDVLKGVFRVPHVRAVALMLAVHHAGAVEIGRYPEETAKRKAGRATGLARAEGFPLTFTIQPAD
ncbi:MAG: ATP-dependent Clp protease adaptor ClpS [Planctomycetota bacterium]